MTLWQVAYFILLFQMNADRFSERSIVEVMNKLMELKLVDVIFTSDGKEYVTQMHLAKEILNELTVHGGKLFSYSDGLCQWFDGALYLHSCISDYCEVIYIYLYITVISFKHDVPSDKVECHWVFLFISAVHCVSTVVHPLPLCLSTSNSNSAASECCVLISFFNICISAGN